MEMLFWLGLPAGAAVGWLGHSLYADKLANQDASDAADSSSIASRDYYKGLTYLLNEQNDQALDVFLNVAKIDGDMIETHLAVGSLFRRRGEVDRALRVHQNLIARTNLSSFHRNAALLELGQDYLAAGLFDRAERVFWDLIEKAGHTHEAYEALVLTYERQSEWQQSIDAAKQCYKVTGANKRPQIAQYYCELAEAAQRDEAFDQAKLHLRDALWFDPHCARASMLLGAQFAKEGQYAKAVEAYEAVEKQDPERVPDVAEPLFSALCQLEDRSPVERLKERISQHLGTYSVLRTATNLVDKADGPEAARAFFKEQLLKHPSLRGLRDWARTEMDDASEHSRDQIQVVVAMLDKILSNKPTHACKHCGFRARQLFWHCPSCGRWDSIKAVAGFEGDGR